MMVKRGTICYINSYYLYRYYMYLENQSILYNKIIRHRGGRTRWILNLLVNIHQCT